MTYAALDQRTVLDYVRAHSAALEPLGANVELTATEIGDGNLNQVFIVHDARDPQRGVIVKQALPYLRVAGDSWPLSRERMRFESQALQLYNQLAPGLEPTVYVYDDDMSVVVMEYLHRHEVMRKPLVARRKFPHFSDHISTFLASTLFHTSDLYLSGLDKKTLQGRFINPHLCKIQEDFVYTHPYMDSPENRWNPALDAEVAAVRANGPLKRAIAEMKEQFMTRGQALIHSDLHTGSIMVNEDETRVIDPEFAFFGPMGFDVGALFTNLVLNHVSHFAHTPEAQVRAEYQSYLLGLIRDIWTQFAAKFDALWLAQNTGELAPDAYWAYPGGQDDFRRYRERYLLSVLQDAAGHGGCEMLRRMMGIVTVWDIGSIADPQQRAFAERFAIRIGSRWVMERASIGSIDDLIAIVQEETA